MLNTDEIMGRCSDCGLEYPVSQLTDIDDSGALRTLCPGCLDLLKRSMQDTSKSDVWANEEAVLKRKPVDMADLMPKTEEDDGILRARCSKCGIEHPIDELIEIDDCGVLRKLCPLCNSVRMTDAQISQRKNQDLKEKKELERAKKIKERNAKNFEKEKKKKIAIIVSIAVVVLAGLLVATLFLT